MARRLLQAKAVTTTHYGAFPILEPNAERFAEELAKASPDTRPITLAPREETEI